MLRYTQILEGAPEIEDEGMHRCEELDKTNELRVRGGESRIYIFQDVENQEYNLGVGLEFISIKHCPFCGRRICND